MMETVIIPDYSALKKQIGVCVDRFSDYILSISSVLRLESSGQSIITRLNDIRNNVLKQNDVTNNGLLRFFTHFTQEFATSVNDMAVFRGDSSNADSKKKSGNNTPNKKKFTTPETLDKWFKEKLKEEIDHIEKVKRKHDILLQELIKKQKVIWETKAQVNETSLLKTKLPKLLDKTKVKYLKLVEKEVKISDELIKATDSIEMEVVHQITTRLSDSLTRLRWLVIDFIPNKKSGKILRQIDDIEVNAVAAEIYQSCCRSYKYAEPAEYFRQLNFDEYLLETPQTNKPKQLNINLDNSCMLDDINGFGTHFMFSDQYEFSGQQQFSYQAQFADKKRPITFRISEFFRKKFGIQDKTQKKKKVKPHRDIIAEHRISTLLTAVFLEHLLQFYRSEYLEHLYAHYMKLLPKFANKH